MMTSSEVTNTFLSITRDWIVLETWKGYQCVPLIETIQMICNMTFLTLTLTWRDLDRKSRSELDLSRSWSIPFEPAWRGKHDGATRISVAFLDQKLWSKNRSQKLTFDDLYWPPFWPEVKNDWYTFVINSDELSNAFFRFSIRPIGAEILGVVTNHPPPVGRGKYRGPVGRGLSMQMPLWQNMPSGYLASYASNTLPISPIVVKFGKYDGCQLCWSQISRRWPDPLGQGQRSRPHGHMFGEVYLSFYLCSFSDFRV